MTGDGVGRRVDLIAGMAGDPEGFHMEEDRLCRAVMRAILDGRLSGDEAKAAIRHVLRLADMPVIRWYA